MDGQLKLPSAPKGQTGEVKAWREPVAMLTYEVAPPDRNPMFLDHRVYQGSCGKVYPLAFHDRIEEVPAERLWEALHIENEFIRVMVLPELGGRIHVAVDKTNGYDFIYRQDVIKPALVGLAGPWISGGIEFNWPQHHRPATYMPVDFHIELHADGSQTLWCGDTDPMSRMKGMHGICLRPGSASIEVKVRLYNRTDLTQTFLWWANIATRVHEKYQSFFPPDVSFVADHARRAMSRFPLCDDHYYGVDYGNRGRQGVPANELPPRYVPPEGEYAANNLSWYANIPVPTSYMCIGSEGDFLGGYDHAARAGIVHVANHHISPGKKQWTWGNHEFGYAWDRNLTDPTADGEYRPYIELMAGVYTDNQPDFSFLAPGETKAFTQNFYPIRSIGPAKAANTEAAVNLTIEGNRVAMGVYVTTRQSAAVVSLTAGEKKLNEWIIDLAPDKPWTGEVSLSAGVGETDLQLTVRSSDGRVVISYKPGAKTNAKQPEPATEIPEPGEIATIDELYLSGVHLAQYRHATRRPEMYWTEALARDPNDSRCNTALGIAHLRDGEFDLAEVHLRKAISRLTHRNANPYDGEPLYYLGLTLRFQNHNDEAYAAFYKATWNAGWRTPAFFALAQLDCRRGDWATALQHLDQTLRTESDHLRARNLKVMVLRKLGLAEQAAGLLSENLALDSLDWNARYLNGELLAAETQTVLDMGLEFVAAGLLDDAVAILQSAARNPSPGTAPLVSYYLAEVLRQLGDKAAAEQAYHRAASLEPDLCFPNRVEEIGILTRAMQANPDDARAPYYLGNLLYDRRRHAQAIELWETSAKLDPSFATVWRNLGIGYFNVQDNPQKACSAYDKAVALDLSDARLFYERDQLHKRLGFSPQKRLDEIRRRGDLVTCRDDLTIELCTLFNQTGDHEAALKLLQSRSFQPWEGGEGLALEQHVRTHLGMALRALRERNDAATAIGHLEMALQSPKNLGEAKHLLANQSDLYYWLGVAHQAARDLDRANHFFARAADKRGDFIGMSVRVFSEMSYYTILALRELGREAEAESMLRGLTDHANTLLKSHAKIDYFATSLPTMLLFKDDLNRKKNTSATVMLAQVALLRDQDELARQLLADALQADPNHALATTLSFTFEKMKS